MLIEDYRDILCYIQSKKDGQKEKITEKKNQLPIQVTTESAPLTFTLKSSKFKIATPRL